MEDDPDRALAAKATALADGVDAALAPWIVGLVVARAGEGARARAEAIAEVVAADIGPRVRALLATDIDAQATTPLALLREAVLPVGELLAELGVAPPVRDEFAQRAFPGDTYGLAPASFEEVADALRGPGIEWGAAKAFVHLRRRRSGS